MTIVICHGSVGLAKIYRMFIFKILFKAPFKNSS